MIILGLDVSSARTGYSVVNNGKLLTASFGTIEPNPKDNISKKLSFFSKQLKKIIKKYKPDYIIVEDIFRGPNIKTFKTLAMFRGVCFLTVFETTGKEPYSMMTMEARKNIGISVKQKEEVFDIVIKKYDLKEFNFKDHNDIVDSIVLAFALYNKMV